MTQDMTTTGCWGGGFGGSELADMAASCTAVATDRRYNLNILKKM